MKPTTETLDGSGNFATKSILPAKRAALALEDYGKLLEAIVAESQEEQLKTAASKFSSSIKNIPADFGGGKLSDSQISSIEIIVIQIGSWVVEAKKKDALSRVVPQMSETIDAIADGFEKMLGTNGSVKTAVNLAAQRNMNGAESRLHERITLAERVILAGLDRKAVQRYEIISRLSKLSMPARAAR